MKTQSFKSLAASFAVAVTLNVSALAGPGPHTDLQSRTTTSTRVPKTTIALFHQQVNVVKESEKTTPEVVQTPGLHGGTTFTYRW